jgi:RNA-binding protein 26
MADIRRRIIPPIRNEEFAGTTIVRMLFFDFAIPSFFFPSDNGYCARGAMCKYSHGDDAVVPGQLYPMNGPTGGMPFLPIFPGAPGVVPFGSSAVYDPHEARMDLRPPNRTHQRAPLLPRIQQEDGSRVVHPVNASGELPVIQDLTPSLPPDSTTTQSEPESKPQFHSPHQQHIHQQPHQLPQVPQMDEFEYGGVPGPINGHKVYATMVTPMDVEVSGPEMKGSAQSRGNFRDRGGGGGGRGTFGGEVHNFRPERRNDKTLVVEKIPEDKLSLEQVNGWFKKFGTVTNVAIDSMNAKALVSFSTHEDAHAAWKSEDAVFGNRFVKVFWHRPMEGHGQVGARMLAASAPLVANIAAKETSIRPTAIPSTTTASSSSATSSRKMSVTPSAAANALAAKQQLLEQQIAEQKSLMASLTTASAEEKKTIMARLRKLGEEMTTTPSIPAHVSSPSDAKKLTPKRDVHDRKERERLDKELEMHSAVAEGEDNAEDLKTKLERLKAEVRSFMKLLVLIIEDSF